MRKRFALVLLAMLCAIMPLAADDTAPVETGEVTGEEVATTTPALTGQWWYGMTLSGFSFTGLQNVSQRTVDNLLDDYAGLSYTVELENEINNLLYSQPWLEYIESYEMVLDPSGTSFTMHITLHEIPMVTAVLFEGNNEVNARTLMDQQDIAVGSYHSPGLLRANASLVQSYYLSHGYAEATVSVRSEINEADNTVSVIYTVSEGPQYKISSINFTGLSAFTERQLKGEMQSKERSFFRSGNFVASTMDADIQTLVNYYYDNGYVDVQIDGYTLEDVTVEGDRYHMVAVNIDINEGSQWLMGTITFSGNSVVSDEQIQGAIHLREGAVHNSSEVTAQIQEIASLYYNDGYIQTMINPTMTRNEDTHTIDYHLTIQESGQSVIERIVITGLTKTKPYVLERELELQVGDVFSQAALQRSALNILNTGIVSDIATGLYQGQSENGVVLEIAVEEGSQMQLQFGATFGGTVDGFPVSGFLQWSDTNLFGTGRDLSISTTLSPDTQAISLSLYDGWVGDRRWSNGISLSFERNSNSHVLQRGTGSGYYRGYDTESTTYPLGFTSNSSWQAADELTSASEDLMSYNFLSFSLSYTTGYTFNFAPGDLSLSVGLSLGLSRAFYDNNYDPFEWIIMKYHEGWQFSNSLSFNLSWDGRDLIENTTRGYLLSLGYTYAGGILGGLSNYNRLSMSAAGYVPLFTYVNDEGQSSSLVLSGTTSLGLMLPQYWNDKDSEGWDWYSADRGATRYEMLYLDGMNTGRGFSTKLWQSILWHNEVALSYPIVRNILNFEAYISADGANEYLSGLKGLGDMHWYFSTGFGIKLKISGFPLGLYWVKTAEFNDGDFWFNNGGVLGGSIVLAITTSIY